MATPDKYRYYFTLDLSTEPCIFEPKVVYHFCGIVDSYGETLVRSQGFLFHSVVFFWIISSIYKSDQEMNISSSCAWYFWRIARGNFNWGQDCDIGAIAICIVYRRNSKIRNCSHTLTGRRLENITIISLQGWSIACWGVDGKYKILSKYLAFGKEKNT